VSLSGKSSIQTIELEIAPITVFRKHSRHLV